MTRDRDPGSTATAGTLPSADPSAPAPIALPIDRIQEYDHNPRRERNEAYDRIKGSLLSRGFAGVLPITRRPGDPNYMAAEGGNTVLHILKELYAETKDPKFHTIQCLFEPWVSESETLIAHLIENDARGELIFIDRARAVHELRALLEQETGQPLSGRQLATALREKGYVLDQPTISKMDYAVETLLSVIPVALCAGLGRDQVERIRKLENLLVRFLQHRGKEATVVEDARQWFLDCLARYDGEEWILEPIEPELITHLAEICGEDRYKVVADFDALARFGRPGSDTPPPVLLPHQESRPRPEAAGSTGAAEDDLETAEGSVANGLVAGSVSNPSGTEARPAVRAPSRPTPMPAERPELPQDVKSLRARLWTLATQFAQRNGLSDCVIPCGNKGCGYLVDLPVQPLFAREIPETAEEAKRVTLWWLLSALAEQWPYGPTPEAAPALRCLPDDARLYPAIEAVTRADDATAIRAVTPLVSEPPSLDIASRQLFAILDEREFELFVAIIQTRRALQAHCRRLGKRVVWDV